MRAGDVTPSRFFRSVAPVLTLVAVWAVMAVLYRLEGLAFGWASFWLLKHPVLDTATAVLQFSLFFVAAAIVSALVTRLIIPREGSQPACWSDHVRHSFLLYALLGLSIAGYAWCRGNCEGLFYGALKVWGLTALGGILGNALQWRRMRWGAA